MKAAGGRHPDLSCSGSFLASACGHHWRSALGVLWRSPSQPGDPKSVPVYLCLCQLLTSEPGLPLLLLAARRGSARALVTGRRVMVPAEDTGHNTRSPAQGADTLLDTAPGDLPQSGLL